MPVYFCQRGARTGGIRIEPAEQLTGLWRPSSLTDLVLLRSTLLAHEITSHHQHVETHAV